MPYNGSPRATMAAASSVAAKFPRSASTHCLTATAVSAASEKMRSKGARGHWIPIGIGLSWFGASPILVFMASAMAIVPLAGLMGDATEALARFLGPIIGGLLNATLGNAPEIIISSFALHAGLVDMVKSSLTGSI